VIAAVSVHCRACGASLPVDTQRGLIACAYCRTSQPLPRDLVERVRAHEAALKKDDDAARAHWASANAEEESTRQDLRHYVEIGLWMSGVGALLVPSLMALLIAVGELEPLSFFWSIPAGGVFAILVVARWHLRRRAEERWEALSALRVAPVDCPGCGASVPVTVGQTMQCPFCARALWPSAEQSALAERAAKDRVATERAREANATRRSWYVFAGVMIALWLIPVISIVIDKLTK
jgi:hypothetical protein